MEKITILKKLTKNTSKSGAGFTLIELLVVIAIIALLASIVLVALNNARSKSRDTKRIGDMNQLAKAFELYYNDKFSYPTSATAGALGGDTGNIGKLLIPNYLSKMPVTVSPADGTCSSTGGVNGSNDYYMYANGATSVTNTYIITFCLGTQVGALPPGSHTLTQAGFQ